MCFGTVDSTQYCTNIILGVSDNLRQLMDQIGEVGSGEKGRQKIKNYNTNIQKEPAPALVVATSAIEQYKDLAKWKYVIKVLQLICVK